MPAHEHINKHLLGALSNYVSLGEIPDFNVKGEQGYEQHQALLNEIKEKGKLNDVPLYRGSSRSVQEDASDSSRMSFISLTPDIEVAKQFADRKKGNGQVHVIPKGSIRTISVNDYDFELPDQADKYGFKQYPWENEHLAHIDDLK